jgi:tetratricopeptide (TPR) repeat protein
MTTEAEEKQGDWRSLVEEGNEAYSKKRYTEAELKFAAALRMAETAAQDFAGLDAEAKDEVQQNLAKSLNNMAALYHTQGKYKMAEDLYNRCLDLKIKLFGEDHLDVALVLHNLAAVHSAKARWSLAEPLYKRALEIRERVLGAEHPDLAGVLSNYALMLRKSKRDQEAEQFENRVKRINESTDKPS